MTNLPEQVALQLHAQGGRMTVQRQLIVDAIEEIEGHPTVDDIYAFVHQQDPSINLSTIYRTLKWLEEQGLINARWFDEKRHKHRFDQAETIDHHHFHCQVCQKIIEFHEPLIETIKKNYEQQTGVQIQNASLVLTGICNDCLTIEQQ